MLYISQPSLELQKNFLKPGALNWESTVCSRTLTERSRRKQLGKFYLEYAKEIKIVKRNDELQAERTEKEKKKKAERIP